MNFEMFRKPKVKRWGSLALLLVAAVIPYLHTLDGPFIWDDDYLVGDDPAIRNLKDAPHIFSLSYWSREYAGTPGQFRPLRALTFAVSYALWGFNPFWYRLTNLVMYVLVVWMVYILAGKLMRDEIAALLAGLIFAVHPAHGEAVAWVKNRTEIMACLMVLLGLWGFWRWEAGKWWGYIVSVAAFPLALLSKEIAVVYPLILFLWVAHSRPAIEWLRKSLALGPHMVLLALYGVFLFLVLGGEVTPQEKPGFSLSQHALVVLWSLWIYLRDLFFPIRLNAEHLLPITMGLGDLVPWAAAAAVAVMGWLWCRLLRWGQRRPAFALSWILVALLPVININYITGRPLADQRVFLASVGACWLMGYGLRALMRMRYPGIPGAQIQAGAYTLAAVILLTLGFYAHQRNVVWTDPMLLYEDTVRKSPGAERAHFNLGNTYKARGEWEKALQAYRKAIELAPSDAGAHNNLGLVYKHTGELEKAEREYLIALKIQPEAIPALMNLGSLYKDMRRYRLAEDRFKEVLSLNPRLAEARVHLGDLNAFQGRFQEAEEAYRGALEIDPQNITARMNLTQLHLRARRWEAALASLDDLLKLNEKDSDAWLLRGEILMQLGRETAAMEALERARSIDPGDPRVFARKGQLLEKKGDLEGAKAEYRAALLVDPKSFMPNLRLGIILFMENRLREAQTHLDKALARNPRDPNVHLLLARLYLDRKEFVQQALGHLKTVLEISPDHPKREEIQRIIESLRQNEAGASPG